MGQGSRGSARITTVGKKCASVRLFRKGPWVSPGAPRGGWDQSGEGAPLSQVLPTSDPHRVLGRPGSRGGLEASRGPACLEPSLQTQHRCTQRWLQPPHCMRRDPAALGSGVVTGSHGHLSSAALPPPVFLSISPSPTGMRSLALAVSRTFEIHLSCPAGVLTAHGHLSRAEWCNPSAMLPGAPDPRQQEDREWGGGGRGQVRPPWLAQVRCPFKSRSSAGCTRAADRGRWWSCGWGLHLARQKEVCGVWGRGRRRVLGTRSSVLSRELPGDPGSRQKHSNCIVRPPSG